MFYLVCRRTTRGDRTSPCRRVTANRGDNPGRKIDDQTRRPALSVKSSRISEAWQMVLGSLQAEMSKALYDTWVQPLKPIGYQNKTFTIGAFNPYGKSWVEERLGSRIEHILENLYEEPVKLSVTVSNSFYKDRVLDKPGMAMAESAIAPKKPAPSSTTQSKPTDTTRSISPLTSKPANDAQRPRQRKGRISPERGTFITGYLFSNWLPLIGHSAFPDPARARVVLEPMTGELRNVVETERGDWPAAALSLCARHRLLNDDLVDALLLRYSGGRY